MDRSGVVYNLLISDVIRYFFVACTDNLLLKILLPVLMILSLVAVVTVVFMCCRRSIRLVFIGTFCECESSHSSIWCLSEGGIDRTATMLCKYDLCYLLCYFSTARGGVHFFHVRWQH